MRDIKFRAWDKKLGMNHFDLWDANCEKGEIFGDEFIVEKGDNLPIMQYTYENPEMLRGGE